jgi:hypothetical protein
VSERRCPHCGGLVAADAEWCGQCLNRLSDAPAEPSAAVETAAPDATEPRTVEPEDALREGMPVDELDHLDDEALAEPELESVPRPSAPRRPRAYGTPAHPFRMVDGRMVWSCPVCDQENPMEIITCPRCGASFGELFKGERSREPVSAPTAITRSLLLPGLGHIAAGQTAEGIARGVMFLWVMGSLIGILLVKGDGSSSTVRSFLLIYGALAAGLYVATAMDAGRAARRQPPLIPLRWLFYGAMGLMAVTVAVLLMGVGGGS